MCHSVNTLQRIIIFCGVLALVVTGLRPPWLGRLRVSDLDLTRSVGYHWVFLPPTMKFDDLADYQQFASYYIDLSRLAVHWILIILATIGLAFVFSRQRPRNTH